MNDYQQLKALNAKVQQLVEDEGAEWDLKFDLIFSENISRKIFTIFKNLGVNFDYYDPDTSYEEDVRAFSNALKSKVEELSKVDYIFER